MVHGFLLVAVSWLVGYAQQPQPTEAFQLAAIQTVGANRYAVADVTKLSGLGVGKPITVSDLQPAADRLVSSGLFKELRYRYVTAGKMMTVVFEFEEAAWTVPVVFDNFIWIPDEDLQAAVRERVPSFDGTSPATEGAPELIRGSLQDLLAARRLPGTVTLIPHTDLKTNAVSYLFAVRDPAPRLCTFTVTGASPDRLADISAAARSLVGGEYSRFYIANMAAATLLDLYHRHGHWKAAFSMPRTTESTGGCEGVNVTLPVIEGPVYKFERAEWAGNGALSGTELDARLGLRRGEMADGAKLTASFLTITKAYGRIGHILAKLNMTPRVDDATQSVVFQINVAEGPQFRMGSLQVVGLQDAAADALKKRFPLAAGAIYDDDLVATFYSKEVAPRRSPSGKAPDMQLQGDRAAGVVNVRFVFQ